MDIKSIQVKIIQVISKKSIKRNEYSAVNNWKLAVVVSFFLGFVFCGVGAYTFFRSEGNDGVVVENVLSSQKTIDVERLNEAVIQYEKLKNSFELIKKNNLGIPSIGVQNKYIEEMQSGSTQEAEDEEVSEEEIPRVQS